MRSVGTKPLQWAKVAGILVLAILIGVAVAIASSPASLR
jgi:hypothetical protein